MHLEKATVSRKKLRKRKLWYIPDLPVDDSGTDALEAVIFSAVSYKAEAGIW